MNFNMGKVAWGGEEERSKGFVVWIWADWNDLILPLAFNLDS